MKGVIQMWGIIIAFILVFMVIPQLMVFGVAYRECSAVTTGVIEVIEVHDGINSVNNASDEIDAIRDKYTRLVIGYNKEETHNEYKYKVVVSREINVLGTGLIMNVVSSKESKRVRY